MSLARVKNCFTLLAPDDPELRTRVSGCASIWQSVVLEREDISSEHISLVNSYPHSVGLVYFFDFSNYLMRPASRNQVFNTLVADGKRQREYIVILVEKVCSVKRKTFTTRLSKSFTRTRS